MLSLELLKTDHDYMESLVWQRNQLTESGNSCSLTERIKPNTLPGYDRRGVCLKGLSLPCPEGPLGHVVRASF